jgi:phosphodiesterase/alkaline phosphatase D-like protein
MPDLILGPLQRYADETHATVWVETDAPCQVSVLGAQARTFAVHDHHYALVEISGLEPGQSHPYEVLLDGQLVWPPQDYEFPQPVIRTRSGREARLVFGSCRGAAPLEPPWNLDKAEDERGLGADALTAYAQRMTQADAGDWPDLLLLLGDQVYADDAAPHTREFIRARRDTSKPPGEEIADFTEYTQLYRESWSLPLVRWLLSTVPVAMMFDDHDIIDDWNTSASWVAEMRATDWWEPRIVGGLVAYWVYQHLGNLSPDALDNDEIYQRVKQLDDAGDLLDQVAHTADHQPETIRWSFERHLGDTHLVVVDSRAARVLDEGRRDMLDADEWRWLEDKLRAAGRRLLIGSSLPIVMPASLHDAERATQHIASGVWGRRAAQIAERVRRAFDLEHWPAFPAGYDHMMALINEIADRNDAPDSITLLSGDVHHAYVERLQGRERCPVHQVVASPMRQTVTPGVMRMYRTGVGAVGRFLGRVVTRLVGLDHPRVRWERLTEPLFANHLATLESRESGTFLHIETAHQRQPTGPAELRTALQMELVAADTPAPATPR